MLKYGSSGFILSDAAQYAFKCQDIYPDEVSFAAAIPPHLQPLFIIPVRMMPQIASTQVKIAVRLAADGSTPEGDLFSYQTFLYNDYEPTVPSSEPGSIFDVDGADNKTHHQEYNFDQNIQTPTDTSYMSDVDITQYVSYPYRTVEKPIRTSSYVKPVVIVRLAIKSRVLEVKTPKKIKDNASSCSVSLISYLEDLKTFNFNVKDSGEDHLVKAGLVDPDHVALSCDCNFWRYNGPEYNAKSNLYLLGDPYGLAYPPNIRDPKRRFWLCKHTYAVVTRLDKFIADIKKQNPPDVADEKIIEDIGDKWTSMSEVVDMPIEDVEPDVKVEWEEEQEEEQAQSKDKKKK